MTAAQTRPRVRSVAARSARRPAPFKTVTLPFPLPRTHTGFPLGNGNFGALVWGVDRLCLTLNRADYWDHRGGEEIAGDNLYARLKALFDPQDPRKLESGFVRRPPRDDGAFHNTRLPVGRFEFTLRPGLRLTRGDLHLQRGQLLVHVRGEDGATRTLTLSLHPDRPLLWIADPQDVLAGVVSRPAWEWVGNLLATRGYEPPTSLDAANQAGWVQACADEAGAPATACLCQRSGQHWVITQTLHQRAAEAAAAAQRDLHDALRVGHDAFTRAVRHWWQSYWRHTPRVSIPEPFFQSFLGLALYKFAAATSPRSPIPAGLQGPWCEEYRLPPWCADYHFNVNIQQIYTLAFSIGKHDHLMPLFDMLDRCVELFRRQARAMVGIDDGILMPHAMDDLGQTCSGISAGVALDPAVSAWTAQLYWLYYRHSGDLNFLRRRALPFMTGVMNLFDAMIEWRDGVPSLPVAISAEYGVDLPGGQRQRCGREPSNQFMAIHMLAQALIDAAAALGQAPDPRWVRLRQAAPPWTTIGEPGKERIAIWQGQDLDVSHRHHGHLACVYPFDTMQGMDDEARRVLHRTLERWLAIGMSDWSEWCLPWAAIIQARAGYRDGPGLLLKICRDLFINEGMATVYAPRFSGFTLHAINRFPPPLETNEVMQLDGAMAIATALFEMLVHTHAGVTRFFPAVPSAWREVAFDEIRLPGPLLAGGRMEGGQVTRIWLESRGDHALQLDVPGYRTMNLHRDGQVTAVTLPLTLAMRGGERIEADGFVPA
jgi:hypothetical protein